ncbi:MAG: hypothetical protein IT445_07685 [Phycisphaeraceae bacterium]|nr:hypothetical protein [Phycisphaeraceae bacterium]
MSLLSECLQTADGMQGALARGWNTWDTRSVLRHVLLPQGLGVTFGFAAPDKLVWMHGDVFPGRVSVGRTHGTKLTSMDKKLPVGDTVDVLPGRHAYDGSYTQLEVNLRGARFDVQTAAEGDDWCAVVRPLQQEPWKRILTVRADMLWNRSGLVVQPNRKQLTAIMAGKPLQIYTDGQPCEDPNLPERSPYLALRLDRPVVISANRMIRLDEAERMIAAAAACLARSHEARGPLREAHEAMQSCLAWNVIYEPKHKRVICTVARDWNCFRGGYAVFCWDGFFMSWMIGLDQPTLGYANALEMFREMIDESFVANIVQGTGRQSRDRSQPPVGSLALLQMHRLHPDEQALRAAWQPLLAWNRWWHQTRRNRKGTISLGSNPCRPCIGDPAEFVQPHTAAGAALESGLDNSPVYDAAPYDTATHLMLVEDVGLTSLYVMDCESLAEIAQALGQHEEAAELAARAEQYRQALRQLWCDPQGIFLNRRLDDDRWLSSMTLTSFYPMLAGAADEQQVERMLREHLLNPDRFDGRWLVPAVPRSDSSFAEQLYLRGRIWPPLNFLVYLGLHRYGRSQACRRIADSSLELLVSNWRKERVVAENYSAMDGTGGRSEHSHPLHGWGGLLAMPALIEQALASPASPASLTPRDTAMVGSS